MKQTMIKASSPARPQGSKEERVNEMVLSRYANLLLDSTFKRAFGTKELMIMFLEEILPGRKIRDITYTNTAHTNRNPEKHNSTFDLECVDEETGERFDVEVQLAKQPWFYERALYYSHFMISEQLDTGMAYYEYPPVYVISLMEFCLHGKEDGYVFRFSLHEDTSGEKMTDRLNFVFLELPNARGPQEGGTGVVEKICYALHNMTAFERRPAELKEKFFDALFKSAEIANFTPEEKKTYREDMANERDRYNQLRWAKEEAAREGRAEGREEGMEQGIQQGIQQGMEQGIEQGREQGRAQAKLDDARNLKALSVDIDIIVKATGLDRYVVENL